MFKWTDTTKTSESSESGAEESLAERIIETVSEATEQLAKALGEGGSDKRHIICPIVVTVISNCTSVEGL